MDVGGTFVATGNREVTATRRARTDEDRVIIFGQQPLEAVDTLTKAHFRAETGDVTDFLVDHFLRQAEFRDLAADEPAGTRIRVVDDQFIAQRRQIACHGQ